MLNDTYKFGTPCSEPCISQNGVKDRAVIKTPTNTTQQGI